MTETIKWATHDPVAVATFVLCFITAILAAATFALYWSTRRIAIDAKQDSSAALKASTEATNLAREEFNATHRPELIVREVLWGPRNEEIRYTLVNRGRNSCTIIESAFELRGSESGQALRTGGHNEIIEAHRTLAPGQFHDVTYTIDADEESFAIAAAALLSFASSLVSPPVQFCPCAQVACCCQEALIQEDCMVRKRTQ
jgi:hypothetical protein